MTRAELMAKLNEQYAKVRREAELERDERIERAIAKDPQIGVLLDQNRELIERSTSRMIAERGEVARIIEDMKRQASDIAERLERRMRALELPPDEFRVRHRCDQCDDTGYVGELRNTMCNCYRQRLLEMIYAEQNLPGLEVQNFATFDLSVFPNEKAEGQTYSQRQLMVRYRAACERYADSFPKTDKLNLVLLGESGIGKTFLLNCVAQRVISRGYPALRMTAFRMFEAMRKHHMSAGEDEEFNEMLSAELLLIDDLGTEPVMRNITIEYLFLLLNERMNARKHTVIVTNLAGGEIAQRYNERVASRLLDQANADVFRLMGTDLRRRKG